MSLSRPVVLMGILLALLLAYVLRPHWTAPGRVTEPPLPGTNTVSGLEVHKDPDGRWMAAFDYFYTGEPTGAHLTIELVRSAGAASRPQPVNVYYGFALAQRGAHRANLEISRPDVAANEATSQVIVHLLAANRTLASQQRAQTIIWPDWQTWTFDREMASKTTDQIFSQAVEQIDTGDGRSLDKAKRQLERVISRDAKSSRGYIELARVAMKSNWGPEGLHQAENLLLSALQIEPDSVNAKILLGYVYAHQGRYKPADALFVEASQTETKNLWLWANWGELLAMQGKTEPAVQKYREAVTRPRTHDTYDRARLDAYQHLLTLLDRRNDLGGMEALYRQRAEEFGPVGCYDTEYARFMLQRRGDSAAAISLARQAANGSCTDSAAREVLGLAHYVAWAQATGPLRPELLNQARVFMPAGPAVLYQLAASEKTVGAAQQLKAAGESIDQRDNDKLNALAYALERKEIDTARRLLRLGARPDAPIGFDDMPVALLPVMAADLDAIRLMKQFGVDYSTLRYRGFTAIDHAKRTGDRRLLEALDRQAGAL